LVINGFGYPQSLGIVEITAELGLAVCGLDQPVIIVVGQGKVTLGRGVTVCIVAI